jgi:hypothetical protein
MKLTEHTKVQMIQMPGHEIVEDNETADQLKILDLNAHS